MAKYTINTSHSDVELNAVRLRFIAIYGCLTVIVCLRREYTHSAYCVLSV